METEKHPGGYVRKDVPERPLIYPSKRKFLALFFNISNSCPPFAFGHSSCHSVSLSLEGGFVHGSEGALGRTVVVGPEENFSVACSACIPKTSVSTFYLCLVTKRGYDVEPFPTLFPGTVLIR